MFNETEIQFVWRCFSLDRDDLIQGSSFRNAFTDLATFDTQNGTSLVAEVQSDIADLTDLEDTVAEQVEKSNLSSVSILNQVSRTFRDDNQSLNVAYGNRSNLKNRIWEMLKLSDYIGGRNRARVLGVNNNYRYRRARLR